MKSSPDKLIAFGWYGGKFSHLNWLLPLLPKTQHFCEPFGGSAAVLINREPSPVETYNDLDGGVVNFFRVLREQKDELVEAIGLTPFSREEYEQALDYSDPEVTPLERARRFYICARQTRTGLAQKGSKGRWAHCLLTSRAGMAGAVSRWLGSVEDLPALEVIKRYDNEETLFYCDPPYPHGSRGDKSAYAFEMSDDQHRELAKVLKSVKGKVALSSYHCDLNDELYGDWNFTEAPSKKIHSTKDTRVEVLWANYDLKEAAQWHEENQQKFSRQHFNKQEPLLAQ
jgi:DNA adenine methylase